MRRLWIGGALGILLGFGATATAQLPQGRSFNFLNGHGYSTNTDPGRSFNFLNGHGTNTTADPGRAMPTTPVRTTTNQNTIDRSITGSLTPQSITGLPASTRPTTTPPTGGTTTTAPPFVVYYPGYGLTPYPGFYHNIGLYYPGNPYSYGLVPGIPVGSFVHVNPR